MMSILDLLFDIQVKILEESKVPIPILSKVNSEWHKLSNILNNKVISISYIISSLDVLLYCVNNGLIITYYIIISIIDNNKFILPDYIIILYFNHIKTQKFIKNNIISDFVLMYGFTYNYIRLGTYGLYYSL